MSPEHRHTPDEEKRIRDAALDLTVEATFPASDPASSLPNPDDDDAIERDTHDAETTRKEEP
jgi:hypothetical protein